MNLPSQKESRKAKNMLARGTCMPIQKNLGSALWLPWHVICFATQKFSKEKFLSSPVETKAFTADTRIVSRGWLRT